MVNIAKSVSLCNNKDKEGNSREKEKQRLKYKKLPVTEEITIEACHEIMSQS